MSLISVLGRQCQMDFSKLGGLYNEFQDTCGYISETLLRNTTQQDKIGMFMEFTRINKLYC